MRDRHQMVAAKKSHWKIVLFFALMILWVPFVSEFAIADSLLVGVKPAEPFVLETSTPEGFSIDLIELLATKTNHTLTYRMDSDLQTHLNAVQTGEVDIGIAATTITAQRETLFDFSQPFFESGQGVLVRDERGSLFDALRDAGFFVLLIGIAVYLLICAHIIWWIERGNEGFSKSYFAGIGDGIWWTIVTMSTVGYGDLYPRKAKGRTFGIIVIISGIAIFGTILAGLTSVVTIYQLQTGIEGLGDLVDERVAVIEGTASVELARDRGMIPVEVKSLDDAITTLQSKRVIAVLYDVPLLQYYQSTHQNTLVLLDDTFEPQSYGIAFPQGSQYTEQFNRALLEVQESGEYEFLKQKWFGE